MARNQNFVTVAISRPSSERLSKVAQETGISKAQVLEILIEDMLDEDRIRAAHSKRLVDRLQSATNLTKLQLKTKTMSAEQLEKLLEVAEKL